MIESGWMQVISSCDASERATDASPTGTSDLLCTRTRPIRWHQFGQPLARPSYSTVKRDSFKIAVIRAPRASQLPGCRHAGLPFRPSVQLGGKPTNSTRSTTYSK
jgi:hypothetical protein